MTEREREELRAAVSQGVREGLQPLRDFVGAMERSMRAVIEAVKNIKARQRR